jgi:antagonist of KipI
MSIEAIKPGLLSTLVAAERTGYRQYGVGPGGPMDTFAMRVANFLVGNDEAQAVIEMHFPGPEFVIKENLLLAITGNGFEVFLNGEPKPLWTPLLTPGNSVLKFKIKTNAGRGYLSVQGGWKAESWLGSRTTHLGVQAGGYLGRALKKGDCLDTADEAREIRNAKLSWQVSRNELDKMYLPSNEIRCVASAETDALSDQSKADFASGVFVIGNKSNRMGFRLEGPALRLNEPLEFVSSPVDVGTVQLLPDGNLIILMADHQTTGGYPRIASVIKADLPKLAQLNPNEKMNFKMIAMADAEALFLSMENQLAEIKNSCRQQLNKQIAS